MLIYLYVVCRNSCAAMAEFSSCDRDYRAANTIWLFIGSLWTPGLEYSCQLIKT